MLAGQVPLRTSSVVAVVRNGNSYSFSHRLRRSVADKVLECINSDLAPSNFAVFLHLKKFLSSGQRFGNDEELKTSVIRWFHSHAAEYYHRVIQKLIPRFDKCLNSGGGYVEK
ncbi:histone-lysine N-methyltransferase SETMAR [Trichonephila clavipes]|nr:histone-lysine N-methyltransferase SETMAR [Trichonephila clavipes]